jgi:hypothetical protein
MRTKQVLFNASPKQTEFLEIVIAGKHRIVAYGGAIRGGKTYSGLFALILLSKMYPGSKWIVVRDVTHRPTACCLEGLLYRSV